MSAETPAPSAAEVEAQAELRLACRNLLRVRLDAATGKHKPSAEGAAWDRLALALDAAEDDALVSPACHAAEVQAARAEALAPVRALVNLWSSELAERGPMDRLYTSGVVELLNDAMGADGEAKA